MSYFGSIETVSFKKKKKQKEVQEEFPDWNEIAPSEPTENGRRWRPMK